MNMLRDNATERGMGVLLTLSKGHDPGGRLVLRPTVDIALHPDQMRLVGRLCGAGMGDGCGGGQPLLELPGSRHYGAVAGGIDSRKGTAIIVAETHAALVDEYNTFLERRAKAQVGELIPVSEELRDAMNNGDIIEKPRCWHKR